MAGWFFGLINRAPVCTLTLEVGTAVTGYPLTMIGDPTVHNQYNVTPSGGKVRIHFNVAGGPYAPSDMDYMVNYMGLYNHNLDGATVKIYYGASVPFASATLYVTETLTDRSGFSDSLITFAEQSVQDWWLELSGTLPATVKIGHVPLGWGIDLGYPLRPLRVATAAQGGIAVTQRGYGLPTRIDRPNYRTVATFKDPTYATSTNVTNWAKGSGHYVAYNTIQRCFDEDYQVSLGSGVLGTGVLTRTGLCAGAGLPMPYHCGSSQGLSTAGRPARYGRLSADLSLFYARDLSEITISIDDVLPRGRMVKPTT